MSTLNPNESLLQGAKGTPSDIKPAPLAVSSSAISFAFQGVQPPSILYVDVDDQLVLQSASNQGAEVVTVNVRLLLPNGRLEDMQFVTRPAGTRTPLVQKFSLAQGYILSVSAACAVAVTRGQTFLRISTQRAASGAGNPAQMLFADYVTTQAASAYPNGRVLSPTEGPGWIHPISSSAPGAGADFVFQSVNNQRLRIIEAFAQLTTSAAVANRNIQIEVLHSASVVQILSALASVAASTTANVTLVPLNPYTGVNPNDLLIPIPPALTLAGFTGAVGTIQSLTTNLQAGDQWSALTVLVEELLENV
jgi:hypothetical protein